MGPALLNPDLDRHPMRARTCLGDPVSAHPDLGLNWDPDRLCSHQSSFPT